MFAECFRSVEQSECLRGEIEEWKQRYENSNKSLAHSSPAHPGASWKYRACFQTCSVWTGMWANSSQLQFVLAEFCREQCESSIQWHPVQGDWWTGWFPITFTDHCLLVQVVEVISRHLLLETPQKTKGSIGHAFTDCIHTLKHQIFFLLFFIYSFHRVNNWRSLCEGWNRMNDTWRQLLLTTLKENWLGEVSVGQANLSWLQVCFPFFWHSVTWLG